MTTKTLKESYKEVCNAYVQAFCKKHGYEYESDLWVAKQAGTIAIINDYCVDMQTIIFDIDSFAPEKEFIKWYDYCLELGVLGITSTPNFESWLKGCPRKSEKEMIRLRQLKILVYKANEELEKALKEKERIEKRKNGLKCNTPKKEYK